jgi:phosphoenolpyruvate phosphomutase / 2-hydroxyethylphosphonate cytidylyltransferase
MKKNKKIVYVGLSADILHEGHINVLKTAYKLGEVTVGLLTDQAIASYKKIPHLNFKQREIVLKNMKFVNKVIPQNTLDYRPNLKLLKPDYVVHGDDWKTGIQKKTRLQVIKTLKQWGGKLVEPKYTQNISSTLIKKNILKVGTSPDKRKSKLKRILEAKEVVRVLESHSALVGLIIENLKVVKNQKYLEFDAMWSSSLTDSALRGKPDNQSVDYSSRILGLNEILDVTTKPIIFDADNGGRLEHLPYMIKSLERIGVSAVIIEDKIGLKKNSLFENQSGALQDTIKGFCQKISKAKDTKISDDFMIIARIESFILGNGLQDALKRAEAYSKAGADAILIHSKEKNPSQIFSFAKKFKKSKYFKPMVAVPSSYSKTYEKDLVKNGFRIIIYANHMMRASYPAMVEVAKSILSNKRSYNAEKKISSVKEIINLIK